MERKSEKIGWIGGWIGGFFWLGLLSGILIVRNRIGHGLLGLLLFAAAIITIFFHKAVEIPGYKILEINDTRLCASFSFHRVVHLRTWRIGKRRITLDVFFLGDPLSYTVHNHGKPHVER